MKKSGFLCTILSIALSLSLGLSICFTGIPVLAQASTDVYNGINLNSNEGVLKTTVWKDTDTVYNETVMFYENRETAKLLYPIDEVISVRSYDLQKVYKEGKDYCVTEDGWLQWLSGGSMPKYKEDFSKLDLFRGASNVNLINSMPKLQLDNQVCVTYTHSTTWEDGFSGEKPKAKLSTDNKFYKKLKENSGEVNAVFFGDSLSVGYNASGLNQDTREWNNNAFTKATATMKRGSAGEWYGENFDPTEDWTCPSWAKQVNAYLQSMSGGVTVNYHNVSIAGKTSKWGSNSVEDQLRNPDKTDEKISPDIMFVGFGMNDTCNKADYKSNIQNIINKVRLINPNCLIVLVSAFNPNHNHIMLKYYEEANNELASNDENIISVPVYTVFTDVKKSKQAADYTSNGFNHVNDFGVRLYAKIIEATLTPVKAVEHTPSQVEVTDTWNNDWGTLGEENGSAAEVTWKATSLISDQVPEIYHIREKIFDKTTRPWSPNCPKAGGTGMTDGNLKNGSTGNPGWYQFAIGNDKFESTGIEPTTTYPWMFVFDLGGTYKISQTTLITHLNSSWARLYKYGFYVGDSEDNVVANMRNASGPVYTVDNGNSGAFHHYSANDDEVTGRYVGIAVTDLNNVINGNYGANFLCILEFAVFGEMVSDEPGDVPQVKQMTFTQSNTLDPSFGTEAEVNTSVEWKRPSIIQGLVPVCTNYNNGTVPAEELTYEYKTGGQPVHNGSATGMTDGSTKYGAPDYGWFQIAGNSTPGESEPIYPWRFTFELDGEYAIDSAALLTHATTLDGMLNNYKIYVSDDLNTLYDGTPVATAVADTSVAKGYHHFSIDKKDAFAGKYIGLEIWDFNRTTTSGLPGSLIIREFAVFGDKISDTNFDLSASEKAGNDDFDLTWSSAENSLRVKVNNAALAALKRDTDRYAYLEADKKYAINISYSVTDIKDESTISLVYNDSSDDYDTLKGHDNGSVALASNKNNEPGDYTVSAIVLGVDKKPLRLAFTGSATFNIKSVNIVSASNASTDTYAVKFYDQRTPVNEAKLLKKGTADFKVPDRTPELNFAGWFGGAKKVTSINGDMKLFAKWCSKYDVNADDGVDVCDLVRLKKSIAAITEDLFYDVNRDDSVNSEDLTELRKALLSGKDFTVDNILFEEGIAYDRAIVTVKTSSVINEDFEGIGVNSIPVSLMENNLSKGNNEAYFELEKSRIIKLKPAIVRLWTQVDWFVTEKDLVGTGEDYYNGIYDFESKRMQALYKYLDAFKQAESKVILVTNWKVGTEIQPWFTISGLSTPETSAPKDIPAYAKAYTELLKYLIKTKGYSNITYVSVANEPDLDDFQTLTGDYEYYQATSKALADELKRANINVSLHGIDSGSSSFESDGFLNRSFSDKPDYFNDYALHGYKTVSEAKEYLSAVKEALPKGKNIWLTEFNGGADFASSRSGFMGLAANLGYKSALFWMLNDVYGETPLEPSEICGGNMGLWNAPQNDATVKDSFYEFALWSRYVLPHSQVLESAVSNEGNIRSTAFKNGEDYTVVVETNVNSATSLSIDFDKKINKKFYKHVYIVNSRGYNSEANGIIPVSETDFDVKTSLVDASVINQKRVVIVYTTIPDITQVNLDKVVVKVENGKTVQLGANATNGAKLTWSVVSGKGSIDPTGNYTATDTKAGDIVAVKAAVDDNTYAIAIVMIQEVAKK